MEEFKSFIFNLFKMYGYTSEMQFKEGATLFKNQQKYDYWIVAENENAYKIQSDIFSILTEENEAKYPCADKNTSLLLLVEQKDNDMEYRESEYVEIENNTLYFKKYVLPFNMTSFHQLSDVIDGECGMVERCILQNDTFEDLMAGREYARLLYAIIHKLPFIPVKTDCVNSIDNAVLYSSTAVSKLADSIDNYPKDEIQQEIFIEKLINEFEDDTD